MNKLKVLVNLAILIVIGILCGFRYFSSSEDDCFMENKEKYEVIKDSLNQFIIKHRGYHVNYSVSEDGKWLNGFFIYDLVDSTNTSFVDANRIGASAPKCLEFIENHIYEVASYQPKVGFGILFHWENDKPKFFYTWKKDSLNKNKRDSTKLKEQWNFIEEKLGKEEMLLIKRRYYEPMYKLNAFH